ncbi:ATP-binding protein [Blastomonas sp.]|uniref:ATP-binding protein n=1 Tax=Blastomonas sp. TaxID=1909299 RepID=UPI00262EAA55|nr:ATP-binding protein [Blastomonas sp.]MDM7957715.1 ATP-binding protein [Blastomonas sp.]
MTDTDPLARIAAALERIAPPLLQPTDWTSAPAYVWNGTTVLPVSDLQAIALDRLVGIEAQKASLVENVRRHAAGLPAHDALLWGARGMGKSALVKAAVAAQQSAGAPLALVQAGGGPDALATLPALFDQLGGIDRRFVVFIDDIGFDGPEASSAARSLRSLLEGGAMARPANVRLAVTSNRRAIAERSMSEQDDPVNPRDAVDDRMALADRFGLSLGFHACDQNTYLAMIAGYAKAYGLVFDAEDALLWARQRGARSGRIAWHYVVELAGRAGKAV